MEKPPFTKVNTRLRSQTVNQIASYVAISKTKNHTEIIERLVCHCFADNANTPVTGPKDIQALIKDVFNNLEISERDIASAMDRLRSAGDIISPSDKQYALSGKCKAETETAIETATKCEEEVKNKWLGDIATTHPALDKNKVWTAMRDYLAQAFKRHGIITLLYLCPESKLDGQYAESLTVILARVVEQYFPREHQRDAEEAIASFLSSVRADRKRVEYVTRIADGAFNYFSLSVSPEVSKNLRSKLSPLTIFLDTNFLFGLLNLHDNSQVDVSMELIDAIKRFHLPFKLRYHEATKHETDNTIYINGEFLKKRKWSQKMSHIAVLSNALPGIELAYHKKNATTPIEADDYLAPYKNWEILLKDKNIQIYRTNSTQEELTERATLEAEYVDFLKKHYKEKPREAIQHDMEVLRTVRSMRTASNNPLESGAMFVTCDFMLYYFDLESSSKKYPASTVLPSTLWQLLRPFISNSEDFDYAFAETFALPEFNLTKGSASKAASRMLSVLASYSEIPEETAVKMLTNDLLLSEIRDTRTPQEIKEVIESELAKQTVVLEEEKAVLMAALEKEKTEVKSKERMAQEIAGVLIKKETELKEKEEKLAQINLSLQNTEKKTLELQGIADKEKVGREELAAQLEKEKARNASNLTKIEASAQHFHALVGVVLATGLEIFLRFVFKWGWLISHPKSIGLQICFFLLVIFVYLGVSVRKWSKWCFTVGFLSTLGIVASLIDR